MARRREPGMVSFDVSSELDERTDLVSDGGAHGPHGADEASLWQRLRDRWRAVEPRRRRRVSLAAGSVALALVGGVVVSGAVAAHTHQERMRAAPGGVVSLDGELTEVWQTRIDAIAAVLPTGGIVALDGDALSALDVADGSQWWSIDLGMDLDCGPRPMLASAVEWAEPVDVVTCLHGGEAERTVTVIAADGAVVGQRELDPEVYGGDDRFVVPAADGGLAVLEHDPALPENVELDIDSGGTHSFPEGLAVGSDASLRVEDALTGELRHEGVVHESDDLGVDVELCYSVTIDYNEGDVTGRAELRRPEPLSTPSMVGYSGCGIEIAASADGKDLATGGAGYYYTSRTDPWASHADHQPMTGGGFVVPRRDGSAFLSAAGSLLESPWFLQVPRATDGTSDDLLWGVEDENLAALDRDGELLWRQAVGYANVAVRTDDVVMVVTREAFVGLDPADGSELWRVEPDASPDSWYTASAVTDGTRATVLLQMDRSAVPVASLLTVDLATGEHREQELVEDNYLMPVAVDGHLLLFTSNGFSVRGMAVQQPAAR